MTGLFAAMLQRGRGMRGTNIWCLLDSWNAVAMKHRPRAEVLDLGLKWDSGAPLPILIAGAHRTVVLCYGSLAMGEGQYVIEIQFEGCAIVRMGHPNDEVLPGHPLWGRGLAFYEAHIVHDSPWLEEHRRINAIHDYHADATWDRLHHYFLVFHDEVVEALARDISARRVSGDMTAEPLRVAAEVTAEQSAHWY